MVRYKRGEGIREEMRVMEQLEKLFDVLDYAWVSGRLDLISRTIENIRLKLWHWFPDDKKSEFAEISYKPEDISSLYDDNDRERVERFGYLESARLRDLRTRLENRNRKRFYFVYGKKYVLIMDVLNTIDAVFKKKRERVLAIEKKGQTFSGTKSFRESMRISTLKKGTGSAPS